MSTELQIFIALCFVVALLAGGLAGFGVGRRRSRRMETFLEAFVQHERVRERSLTVAGDGDAYGVRIFNVIAPSREEAESAPWIPHKGRQHPVRGGLFAEGATAEHVAGDLYAVSVLYTRWEYAAAGDAGGLD